MKRLMVGFFLLLCIGGRFLHADSWSTPQTIPLGASSGAAGFLGLAYDAENETIVLAWTTSSVTPYYSVFNGTAWSAGAIIPPAVASSVEDYVNLTYNAANGTVLGAWTTSGNIPRYSVFNGTTWNGGGAIPLGSSTQVTSLIGLTYNAANETVVAAWADNLTNAAHYSVFNGTTWTTTGTGAIALGTSDGIGKDISLTYDAANGTVVAAWPDFSAPHTPYYSVFNGTIWSPGATMNLGTSGMVDGDIFLTYDAANEQVVASWTDITDALYYSVFNGTTWSPGAAIPLGASPGAFHFVNLTYDAANETVVAAWTTSAGVPYYSMFNGTTWSAGAAVPLGTSANLGSLITLTYDAAIGKVMATWADTTGALYYSIFSPSSFAPENLTGKQKKNDFGLVYELVNILEWQSNPSSTAVGYFVYRNGVKIATLDAATLSYEDHNRKKKEVTSYSVTSFNASSNESPPANVTIP